MHDEVSSGQPISRILSSVGFTVYAKKLLPVLRAWAIISLGSLPGTDDEAGSLSSLLGLAPGGGCLAARITADAGGLLHHLFTVTSPPEGEAVCFCGPNPAGLPKNRGFPVPGFPRRRAVWSADFPRPFAKALGRDRPASLKTKV
jgi:hypothetical protein